MTRPSPRARRDSLTDAFGNELVDDTPAPAARESDDLQDQGFLGREFLCWLLWRVDRALGELGGEADGGPFTIGFGGRVRLKALAGDVSDEVLKGAGAAHSVEVRAGLGAGRSIREAELRIVRDEREWKFTIEADTLDLRGVKLPALLTEEDDDKFLERLALIEELDEMVKLAFAEFMRERARPEWTTVSVPAIGAWLADGLRVSPGELVVPAPAPEARPATNGAHRTASA